MPEVRLTQPEADALLVMEKHRADETTRDFPSLGGVLSAPLVSADGREQFILDIRRGRIDLAKVTYQNRTRTVVILLRLDLAGAPHRNPDGVEIPCPHLHRYREGYGDKWAGPAPPDVFRHLAEPWASLDDFQTFCNITRPPLIQKTLFV